MKDHVYQPSTITVPAGEPATLEFENAGSVAHYFVVGDTSAGDGEEVRENLFREGSKKNRQTDGHGEDEEHEDEEQDHENEFELPPGGSGSITFTLPESTRGTYTFACFARTGGEKHHEMGMKGTMIVTADAEE